MTVQTLARPESPLHRGTEFDALSRRLDELAPLFRDSAVANEELGRLIPEVERALTTAGVYKISVPAELGGYEFTPRQIIDTIAKLSYQDASTGWAVMAVQMATGSVGACLDIDAAREYFDPGATFPTFAGQGTRPGKAVKVDGGYRISGSWQFASGMHQATHIHTAAIVDTTGDFRIFNLPKEQATLADNWDVMGLKATGSIDYTIDNVFVPEENTYIATSTEKLNGGSVYRIGVVELAGIGHCGWAIGVGRRMLDELKAHASSRINTPGAVTSTDEFCAAFARAEANYRGATALVEQTWADIENSLEHGEHLSVEQQTMTRLALNTITSTLEDVSAVAYKWAGTTALRAGDVQRIFRDVHAGIAHVIAGPLILQNCGRQLADLAPNSTWSIFSLIDK